MKWLAAIQPLMTDDEQIRRMEEVDEYLRDREAFTHGRRVTEVPRLRYRVVEGRDEVEATNAARDLVIREFRNQFIPHALPDGETWPSKADDPMVPRDVTVMVVKFGSVAHIGFATIGSVEGGVQQ